MAFVNSARETLTKRSAAGERLLAPLAFLPYLMWELNGAKAPSLRRSRRQ